jgi:hypothetical protein
VLAKALHTGCRRVRRGRWCRGRRGVLDNVSGQCPTVETAREGGLRGLSLL